MKNKTLVNCFLFIIVIVGLMCFFLIFHNTINKNLEIVVKTNGGVPFKWEYEIEDTSIVKFVEMKEVENKNTNGMVGAEIQYKYVFKGLKEGTTNIVFRYVDIRDGAISQEEVHNIKVDKNLKVTEITK